jgi:LacI family transcriptional regulator
MTSMDRWRPPSQADLETPPITIALIGDGMLSRSYAGTVISGVHAGALEWGASVVLAQAKHAPGIPGADLGDLLVHEVIGVIIASDGGGTVNVPSMLDRIPHVVLNARCFDGASQIIPDHDHAAQAVVRELVDAGHVRIGYVGGRASTRDGDWLRAVARALIEADVFDPALVITDSPDAAGGHRGAITALRQPVPPTALICMDGRMAIGAYQAAQELQIVIPNRLSVIALDDAEIPGEDMRPPLTTVHLPYFRMGLEAVRSLVGQIRDGQIREGIGTETRVICDIVRRQSVCAASPAYAAP